MKYNTIETVNSNNARRRGLIRPGKQVISRTLVRAEQREVDVKREERAARKLQS